MNGASAFPEEGNDEDVTRLAQEFERKYGNAYSGKKEGFTAKGKGRGLADLAAGYDESDDFIDNTEAVNYFDTPLSKNCWQFIICWFLVR